MRRVGLLVAEVEALSCLELTISFSANVEHSAGLSVLSDFEGSNRRDAEKLELSDFLI